MVDMETARGPVTEEDFKPQRVNIKRGSTSGKTWEVDIGKERVWVSSQHQSVGQQISNDTLEKGLTNYEEHCSFLVDSSGHDEGARDLPKEAGSRSVKKAPKLGRAAKSIDK